MLRLFLFFMTAVTIGCATPTTRRPTITLPELEQEITFQVRAEYRQLMQRQERINRIADPLLMASYQLCEAKQRKREFGFYYFDQQTLEKMDHVAKILFLDYYGLEEVPYPFVAGIRAGSNAKKKGLLKGDRILEINGSPVNTHYKMVKRKTYYDDRTTYKKKLMVSMTDTLAHLHHNARFKIRRIIQSGPVIDIFRDSRPAYKDTTLELLISKEGICGNKVLHIESGQVNAFTDGENIGITTGMLDFASDEELALVIAHELAHCIENHIGKKKTNSWLGSLAGGIVDGLAGSIGVHTYGRYSKSGADIGAVAFSQAFELEADYIGLYILARAGWPTENAAAFWRKMAERDPDKSNSFAGTHPPTSHRYLLLSKTHTEIKKKKVAGDLLMPNRQDAK